MEQSVSVSMHIYSGEVIYLICNQFHIILHITGTSYSIYSCPLDIFGKKCRKRGWLPYAPYGIKHTYLKIGNTCYDWGDWNYVVRKCYCKTLIFCGYLILAILAGKTKSAKICVRQCLIFNTLTYVQLYRGSDKKENLVSS